MCFGVEIVLRIPLTLGSLCYNCAGSGGEKSMAGYDVDLAQ